MQSGIRILPTLPVSKPISLPPELSYSAHTAPLTGYVSVIPSMTSCTLASATT